jgi:thiamine-monophosphate kinase
MGGIPRWALVALAVPAETDVESVDAFYAGMREAAAPHGVTVRGRRHLGLSGGWTVNVTLLGIHPGEPRLRSHARAGDAVAVTGRLGASAPGLTRSRSGLDRGARRGPDRRPARRDHASAHSGRARGSAEGRWLGAGARRARDDGLLGRPRHRPRARLPRERGGRARAPSTGSESRRRRRGAARALGADAREWASGGGEDYELLLTCDPAAAERLVQGLAEATGTAPHRHRDDRGTAGEIVFVDADGSTVPMRGGIEHFHG